MKVHGRLLVVSVALACLWLLTLPSLLRAQDEPQQPDGQQQPGQTDSRQPVDQIAPSDTRITPDSASAPVVDQTAPGEPAEGAEYVYGRVGPNYVIGPEDEIEVSVFNIKELDKLDVQVANDGTISVPLLGSVKAAGLTQSQLRDELARLWGEKYIQDPQVSLFIKEFKARPISVIGAVEKPGRYFLKGRLTLIEALALAGGLGRNGSAAGKSLYVERAAGFQDLPEVDGLTQTAPDKIEVDLKKLIYSVDTALNIEVKPFDIISVGRADVIYVVGAVKRSGGFVLGDKESVSVLQALAMAEGYDHNAALSRARIIHRSASGALTEVPVDLGKVLKGRSQDTLLAANDILFVPDNTAKSTGKQAINNIVGVVGGLLVYGRL